MAIILCALLLPAIDVPQDDGITREEVDRPTLELGGTRTMISQQWFLAYSYGEREGDLLSAFQVNRGYINIKTKLTPFLSTRITPDLTVDKEGDGRGDLELRFKYVYLRLHGPDSSFMTDATLELGLVHRPWLDFEEHINYYRAQGTMFLERSHLLNSADAGVTFMTLLGPPMSKEYKESVNGKYAGRWGSLAVGVYNGGGYHALESNLGKTVEWRLTLRPLPDFIPGLQLSYAGAYGSGNTAASPTWEMHYAMLSWESHWLVVTGSYYTGLGNSSGDALTPRGRARHQNGASGFVELRLHPIKTSILGRYDYFDPRDAVAGDGEHRIIGGIAYHFFGHFKAILDYDQLRTQDAVIDQIGKLTVEVNY
jgi:hypothetical protein